MNRDWFNDVCNKNNFPILKSQLDLLEQYVLNLLNWNKKINLISRRDEDNIWQRHILGSIAFLFKFSLEKDTRLIDVGTGGGLPGIPIAILFPDIKVTLLDSIKKKYNAVCKIVFQLGLSNVEIVHGRAEVVSKNVNFEQSYDYVIARAVAPIDDLIKWCKPFLKVTSKNIIRSEMVSKYTIPKGSIVLLKGGELEAEIYKAKQKSKPRCIDSHSISIQNAYDEVIEKKLVIIQP